MINVAEQLPYVDDFTLRAFNKTGGGDYISISQLAAIGQISRS